MVHSHPLVQTLLIAVLSAWPLMAFSAEPDIGKQETPAVALTGALLIDGTGAAAKPGQTVLVRDGRITDIGPDGAVALPKETKIIPMAGKSLLPGWVMMHEHLYYHMRPPPISSDDDEEEIFWRRSITRIPQIFTYPALYLADGVTTASTAGPEAPWAELKLQERIRKNEQIGPDLFLTIPKLREARGPDDARRRVRFWAGQGASSVKVHARLKKDEMAAAIDEAHKLGLKVTGHLGYATYREAVDIGIDQIEHGFAGVGEDFCEEKQTDQLCPNNEDVMMGLTPDDPRIQALFQHIIDNDVIISSTMAIQNRVELPARYKALLNESGLRDYEAFRAAYEADIADIYRPIAKKIAALDAAFWRAGGFLVVGSDASGTGNIAGFANLKSIELLVDAGIPPLEAIKVATHNGAVALDLLDDRGTIEVGKRADMIIVNGDPSVDIRAIYEIETVFKAGVAYNSAAIKRQLVGTIGGPF